MLSVGAVVVGVVGIVGACDDDEQYGTPPPAASSRAAPSSPGAEPSPTASPTDEQQIIAQYRRFWLQTLPAVFAAAPAQRRALLTPVVMNPQLDTLLTNLAALEANGEKDYGTSIPLRQTTRITNRTALVTGCLDSRKAGIVDARSGRMKSHGVARNPVRATLKKNDDAVWRVYAVAYPGGTSC
jgi:hypothetical protein